MFNIRLNPLTICHIWQVESAMTLWTYIQQLKTIQTYGIVLLRSIYIDIHKYNEEIWI